MYRNRNFNEVSGLRTEDDSSEVNILFAYLIFITCKTIFYTIGFLSVSFWTQIFFHEKFCPLKNLEKYFFKFFCYTGMVK